MILIHDVPQGSSEWWDLRTGIPTASRFKRLIQPGRLKPSKGIGRFAAELIGERLLGKALDEVELDNIWTARGTEEEDRARRWYAAYREVEVRQVGFVTMDFGEERVGCSPDLLVGDEGGAEIKVRGAKKHMACVLGVDDDREANQERLQVQGSLWVTHRNWWDVVHYNPVLPKRVERHYPVPKIQTLITEVVDDLFEKIAKGLKVLEGHGDVVDIDRSLLAELQASLEADGE